MKEYKCEQIYDSKNSKAKEVAGIIAMGLLGGLRDTKAEKYIIRIDDVGRKFFITGMGHSAWGGVPEIKENEKDQFELKDIEYSIEKDIITVKSNAHVRKFRIVG